MSQEPAGPAAPLAVELILLRQVASYLDLPMFLVDADGRLLYFNEPAEPLLGLRFDDVGELAMADWLAAFRPRGEAGEEMAPAAVPLVVALHEARAVHVRVLIRVLWGVDGQRRAPTRARIGAPRSVLEPHTGFLAKCLMPLSRVHAVHPRDAGDA